MSGPRAHPDELTTAAYLDGALLEPERDRFEAHLVGCDACRDGIVVLRLGDDDAATAPPEWVARARFVPDRGSRRAGRLPGWALAAAAATVLAGGLALLAPPLRSALPIFRSGKGSVLAPLEPTPGSRIAPDALRFRWSGLPGADRYRITLRTAAGERLGTIVVPGAQLELRWEGAAPRSTALLWTVEALSLDRVIAESRPTPFELR